jgi:hypothetical protein
MLKKGDELSGVEKERRESCKLMWSTLMLNICVGGQV